MHEWASRARGPREIERIVRDGSADPKRNTMMIGRSLGQTETSNTFIDGIIAMMTNSPLTPYQQQHVSRITARVMARYNAGYRPAFTPADFKALYAVVSPRTSWSPFKL
jgi:hypothetical protein